MNLCIKFQPNILKIDNNIDNYPCQIMIPSQKLLLEITKTIHKLKFQQELYTQGPSSNSYLIGAFLTFELECENGC